MELEVDITITLMVRDAVIQLKDGVWQYFAQNQVATSAHFYFLPKHINKTVTLIYRASFIDLKLLYMVWKTDDKTINAADWPFPMKIRDKDKSAARFKPSKYVLIDQAALK